MNNNLIGGIIVIAICTYGYLLALKNEKKNKDAITLFLLIVCGFLLRLYCALDVNLHAWDERYHALVAKNLLNHLLKPTLYDNPILPYDYTNFTISHVWIHKQPLTLWLIALSLKIFGFHAWAVRLPSVLLSTIGIKLIYDIAAYLYTKKIAFISAFLFSIHGLIIDLATGRTATDHVDVAFMFFILLGVWLSIKNEQHNKIVYATLVGISMGCAVLCKWLPALIILPLWFLIFYNNEKRLKIIAINLSIILLAALFVILPWQVYILHHYPTEAIFEYQFNAKHIHQVLSEQGGNWFYHFNCLRMSYGELIYIPVIWFAVLIIKQRRMYDIAIYLWFLVPYLFFSFCATKMQAYTVFAAPAIFIITANAFVFILEYAKKVKKLKWLYLMVGYGLIILPIRYSIERVKPFDIEYDRHPAWEKNIETFKTTPNNNSKTVVLGCEHCIELMFETDCIAYSYPVDSTNIQIIKSKGYNVINWKD